MVDILRTFFQFLLHQFVELSVFFLRRKNTHGDSGLLHIFQAYKRGVTAGPGFDFRVVVAGSQARGLSGAPAESEKSDSSDLPVSEVFEESGPVVGHERRRDDAGEPVGDGLRVGRGGEVVLRPGKSAEVVDSQKTEREQSRESVEDPERDGDTDAKDVAADDHY